MFIQLIKLLSGESMLVFGTAIASSMISGLMTLGAFVLLFRSLRMGDNLSQTWWAFAVIALAALATRGLANVLLGYISRKAVMDVRLRLARSIADAPLIGLERFGNTRLMGALSNEVVTVAAALPNLVRLAGSAGFIIACLGFLGWLSPERLGVILIVMGIGLVASYFLRRQGRMHMRVSRQKWDDLLQTFSTLVEGAKELKLDPDRRRQVLSACEAEAGALRTSTRNQFAFFSSAAGAIQLLLFLTLGFMVLSSDLKTAADRELLIAYSILLIYMIASLRSISTALRDLNEAELAFNRIQELGLRLDASRARRDSLPFRGEMVDGNWKRLELVNVTHSYQVNDGAEEFTLGPASISFGRGEVVFITGGNGSGKTTLAKLITGLYFPQTGEIRVDGKRIAVANDDSYRRQFSAIFSDFFLFDTLIEANDPAVVARASEWLSRFQISGKVRLRGHSLSTTTMLSLGERKRLALIFACLQDRPAYLLDEWSAEQDPAFKDIFYRQILGELRNRGKLVIVISHDDRYFDVADRIIVLERGAPIALHTQASTLPSNTRSQTWPSITA